MQITLEIATKVRDTVAAGLVKGAGNPVPGQMCVEAAVCYALGLPHGDDPQCVARSLRSLKIAVNDAQWSSPQARAHGLRKLALLQLGSAGAMDDRGFARRVALMTIRTMLPVALRAVAKKVPTHAQKLAICANFCAQVDNIDATAEAAEAAKAAADATAYGADATAYAAYAAKAAAYAADAAKAVAEAANAAEAADATAYAAYAAKAAAYAAKAAAYAADAAADAAEAANTRDKILTDFCEGVAAILIDMQVPGCMWLPLLEEDAG